MVKEGYAFGFPPLVAGFAALLFQTPGTIAAGVALMGLGLFVFYFFRDPERAIPTEAGAVVSPADGRVMVVQEEANAERPGKRVSVFLAIWNVHVNRSPAAGTITKLEYKPGKFLGAWVEKASLENEQNVFTLASEHGEMVFKQIAGYVARRVVSWKKQGETVARGERIGLVRFGSRVDIWLPENAEIAVKVGEHVKGGSTVVARMMAGAPSRLGGPEKSQSAKQKMTEEGGRS